MEAFGIVLLWLHLMAIAVAGAAAFGIPVVGAAARRGTADHRPVLMAVAGRLSMAGRGALVVLLVTGPLLIWAKYGGVPPGPWFSIKMVVVLLLVATVILSGFNAKWMAFDPIRKRLAVGEEISGTYHLRATISISLHVGQCTPVPRPLAQ